MFIIYNETTGRIVSTVDKKPIAITSGYTYLEIKGFVMPELKIGEAAYYKNDEITIVKEN